MSKSGSGELWLAVNHAANIHREIKPFMRIERDGIGLLQAREQFSRRFREDGKGAITPIHMHPKLEAVGNFSNLG